MNANGGLLARKVELIIYDDESDPKQAAVLYEKLIVEDKVDVLLGPYGSLLTDPVADLGGRNAVGVGLVGV